MKEEPVTDDHIDNNANIQVPSTDIVTEQYTVGPSVNDTIVSAVNYAIEFFENETIEAAVNNGIEAAVNDTIGSVVKDIIGSAEKETDITNNDTDMNKLIIFKQESANDTTYNHFKNKLLILVIIYLKGKREIRITLYQWYRK